MTPDEMHEAQERHAAAVTEKAIPIDLRVPWDQNANADRVRREFWQGLYDDWYGQGKK